LIKKVKETIERTGMIRRGDRVLVAFSGGPDSSALLDVLGRLSKESGFEVSAAHLNHMLRGVDADRDMEFARNAAKKMEVPFIAGREDVGALKRAFGISTEEAARLARRNFLEHAAVRVGANLVALGHTSDDRIETVLMRMIRGTGYGGLRGITYMTGNRIRPLLDCSHGEIIAYLEGRGMGYVTDASNSDAAITRNRIRLELIPLLERGYNAGVRESLLRLARSAEEDDAFIESALRRKRVVVKKGNAAFMHRLKYLALDPALRFRALRHAYEMVTGSGYGLYSYHFDLVERLMKSKAPNRSIPLPIGSRLERSYDEVRLFMDTGERAPGFDIPLQAPGITYIAGTRCMIDAELLGRWKGDPSKFGGWKALISGDRFQPLGMKGSKKVKDFFIELKVPAGRRKRVPIICVNGQIAWVCGYRISEKFKITGKTVSAIKLEIKGCDNKVMG
jgi:tRNA(Ile)-lysidine synthase